MERRDFLRRAAASMAATTVAAPAIAESLPDTRWRLTTGFESAPGAFHGGADIFASQLAELTDNRFHIEVLPADSRQAGAQAFDTVASGAAEMAHAASNDCFAKDPTFALASSVPFGLSGRQQHAWLLQGGGNEALNAFYAKYNVYGLPMGNTGAAVGGWYRKEIRSVADLRGLKVSVGGIAGQVLTKLGVVSQVPGASATVYAALERGAIDGIEWHGTYDDETPGFARVAPYYYTPAFTEGGADLHLFINLDRWRGLPKSYRSAIANAAVYANSWMQARAEVSTAAALKRLVAGGAQLRSFPRDVMKAAELAAMELYTEISAKNADFKTMIELMMAFRNDAFLWWQVAEYSNDDPAARPPSTSV